MRNVFSPSTSSSSVGWNMTDEEGKEEYDEVQADLKRREDEVIIHIFNENEIIHAFPNLFSGMQLDILQTKIFKTFM